MKICCDFLKSYGPYSKRGGMIHNGLDDFVAGLKCVAFFLNEIGSC